MRDQEHLTLGQWFLQWGPTAFLTLGGAFFAAQAVSASEAHDALMNRIEINTAKDERVYRELLGEIKELGGRVSTHDIQLAILKDRREREAEPGR